MASLVLTLIGPDQPGLVDSVAALVRECDGNWLESRMSHLAGVFAGIVRVEVADAKADELIQRLNDLEPLSVTARQAPATEPEAAAVVWMELVGNDRPGIVSEVSRVLSEQRVNVEEFHTECTGAPNSGVSLFRANAALGLPPDTEIGDIQAALEAIALDLMVDIRLAPDCDDE